MRFGRRFCILMAVVVFFAGAQAGGEILNGGFEVAEPNSQLDFDPPADWERENYAAVMDNFVPYPERGTTDNWKIDVEAGLNAFEGDFLVVLSTGDVMPDPYSASLSQSIEVYAGQRLSGLYFFGTCDYVPFPDVATITLVPDSNSGLEEIEIVNINVADVGDYGSMAGWEPFVADFNESTAGVYELILEVTDIGDNIFKSYLLVDGVTLCTAPAYGDISYDCVVNFRDFAVMAWDWGADCSDPNYAADPNSNCRLGSDIDGGGPVDMNDLQLLAGNWLEGL